MSPAAIASLMMLTSGAAHATVNAVLKSGKDKMSSRALIDGFSALMVLPLAFLLPLPTHAWVWLAASGAIHLVYLISLIRAFESADMMVTYPLMRGMAPMLASLVAVTVFHEPLTLAVAAGIGCVSVGVMVAAPGRHPGQARQRRPDRRRGGGASVERMKGSAKTRKPEQLHCHPGEPRSGLIRDLLHRQR